jgi:xylulokinase
MERKYLLGIDIGTQSVKVCLFDINGDIVEKQIIPQYMDTIKPGWASENPNIWWKNVCDGLNAVIKKSAVNPDRIAGLGIDAVMHSPVGITRDGELTDDNVQMYCDKRNADLVMKLHAKSDLNETVHRITSNLAGTQWMGMKIAWIKEHMPDSYDKTYKYISAKDFINYKLCGEIATDPSEASGTCLLKKDTDEWSCEVSQILNIDYEKLPKLRNAFEVIGTVHGKAAVLTGLKKGTPVVCGGGDMLCGLFGAGLVRKGVIADLTGTGSVLAYYDETPCMDKRIANLRHVIGGWTPYNCLDSSGGALRWFCDNFCKDEMNIAEGLKRNCFEYLESLSSDVPPGSNGAIFFPYLQGERNMGTPYAKGVFFGMTSSTTVKYLFRAVMEGVAFELNRMVELFRSSNASGDEITKLIHIGGASKSLVWSQIKADIYNLPVEISNTEESTAWGSAVLAGIGAGVYADSVQAVQIVENTRPGGRILVPNQENRKLYDEMFDFYKITHDTMVKPFERHAEILGGGQ